jgi:two-component system sensor histidine kinase UhpB
MRSVKLRTRLNLVIAGLSCALVAVLVATEIQSARDSVREEVEAANRVAGQLLGRIVVIYSQLGGPDLVLHFMQEIGRIRANEVYLLSATGAVLYQSPPATYKAGRAAPLWFTRLLAPPASKYEFSIPGNLVLVVEGQSSRAILDAWDNLLRLAGIATLMLGLVNALAFWVVGQILKPFPVVAAGLQRLQHGDLSFRLPPLAGHEAQALGSAFNSMAQAMEDKVRAERKAQDAETRLDERREMASITDQRIEEERRLIAHELHDEFGQSVTAIRSLALAIVAQKDASAASAGTANAASTNVASTATLIAEEAARLYDAMHGLIPRLTPLSLDTLGLATTLDNLVRDWQRRHPTVALTLRHALPPDLGPSVTLTIYRLVQEGLINALRHAQATRVDIDLSANAERIAVTLDDNGVGLPADWARPGHFGLRGLSDRVAQLSGRFEIANRSEGGVRLRAEIPLAVVS